MATKIPESSYVRPGSHVDNVADQAYKDLSEVRRTLNTVIDEVAATGAPATASYVTLATNATLTSERVLTAGVGITTTDAGAGSTLTVALDRTNAIEINGIWTFDNYIYLDATANQIQLHSDSAGKVVLERNGTAGTFDIGNNTADLDTTLYGDLQINGALSLTGDITGSSGTAINGGTTASVGLSLESTTHGTKGGLFFASATGSKIYTHGAATAYSDFVFGSGVAFKLNSISSNTTLDHTHTIVLVDCSGGNVTVTLPVASGKNGRVHVIRRIDGTGANTLTVSRSSADNLYVLGAAGATTYTVAIYQTSRVVSDGATGWWEF